MTWVFWISVALIGYTYVGYAAWLWVRSRIWNRPVAAEFRQPFVSIVMVVRNEALVMEAKLRNLLSLNYPRELVEIVVTSDGSTDETNEIVSRFAQRGNVRLITKECSQGKAAGLNAANTVAQGEIVVFTDARQMIEPGSLQLLANDFADLHVGCSSGELMLGEPRVGESSRRMGLYWRIEKNLRELESASGSVVGATGALYAVRRSLLCDLPQGTILDDVLIPMNVVRQGYRVIFNSKARAWDVADQGMDREFSRKVRTLSGNYQLLHLAPWLLRRENPIRFEFIGHKLLRLLVPFALIATLLSSLFLHATIYRIAMIAQFTFYALSLVAMTRLARGPVARVADAAFTFVVLNTAATVAFANFVMGRKAAWSGSVGDPIRSQV